MRQTNANGERLRDASQDVSPELLESADRVDRTNTVT